eukprot:49427-Eustigmatos_ZCMA.PRE.1
MCTYEGVSRRLWACSPPTHTYFGYDRPEQREEATGAMHGCSKQVCTGGGAHRDVHGHVGAGDVAVRAAWELFEGEPRWICVPGR